MENGNTWQRELADKRVAAITASLQNGGRGLTWNELRSNVMKEVPGKLSFDVKLIKKAAYGLEQGKDVSNIDHVRAIKLPWSRAMTKWEAKREEERLKFVKQADSRARYNEKIKKLGVKVLGTGKGWKKKTTTDEVKTCKRGHPRTKENIYANGACKLCNTVTSRVRHKRRNKRISALEAVTRAQESSLDNIAEVLSQVPAPLRPIMEELKETLQMNKYGKLIFTLNGDRAHIALMPLAQMEYYEG